jgi:Carboxypeptidase Taq (M32) metallopeptidase
VHESQSLLWERMVSLTTSFCTYLLPKIQETFPEFGKGKTPEARSPRDAKWPHASHACACLHICTCMLVVFVLDRLGLLLW